VGPTIRGAILVDYVEGARAVGLDPNKMLERAGLLCFAWGTRLSELCRGGRRAPGRLPSAARAEDFAMGCAGRRGLSRPMILD
jgi:hypothetical protein